MPLPPDVTTILSDADLDRLRTAFRVGATGDTPAAVAKHADANFGTVAESVLLARFPPAGQYVRSIGDYFYDDDTELASRNRERVVIATLLSHANDGGYYLCLHLYWALMVGLSVKQVAWTIVLTSAYSGIDRYTMGMTLLGDVLGVLKGQLASGDESAIAPLTVVGQIGSTFAARH